MDKYEMTMAEMIEVAKIETIINRERQGCITDNCDDCRYFGRHYCSSTKKAEALYYEGCRIVGEDEIVVKKSKIGMLEKTIDYLEMEKAQLNKQLEQAEQETAREILQEVVNAWNTGNLNQRELAYICTKYGIELEKNL